MSVSPGGLSAVRLALDPGPPIDPFALAGAEGIVFHSGQRALVGLGSALRIPLPHGVDSEADLRRAAEVVTALPCDDRFDPATAGVIGFGALPFERASPGVLVIPEVTYGRDGDREWATVVAAAGSPLPSTSAGLRWWLARRAAAVAPDADADGSGAGTVPDRIAPLSSDDSFLAMVAEALEAIGRGDLVKVVLARHMAVNCSGAINVPDLLRRWRALEPNCTVFSVPTADGQFVGASPELLVERCGTSVISRPLAGTAERFIGAEGSVLPDTLLESRKDAAEHRLVVDAIHEALSPLCSDLEVPAQPDLVRLHTIIHLGTSLRGTLAPGPDGSIPDALRLVGVLHPTPAVGGVPSGAARDMISRLEPEPRGHYAGPVGYVDARGDGRWMVGIRAMTVDRGTARLTAGVGIVDGSEPAVELVETNLKLTAVLEALAPDLQRTVPAGAGSETTAG